MDLNEIQEELTKRNIPVKRLRGRIEVTEVSGKAGLSGYWNYPQKFIFGFAVNNGSIFSVIYRDDNWNLRNNNFALGNIDEVVEYGNAESYCESVKKMNTWWRVVNMPKKNENVEKFVQRSFNWFDEFQDYIASVAKEDCRRKLVRNILNGSIEDFSKSLTNIKKSKFGYILRVSGNLNEIPVKIGWNEIENGAKHIVTLGIGKTHHRMTFTNKWGDDFNFKDFISKSVKAYEYAYLGKNPVEEEP